MLGTKGKYQLVSEQDMAAAKDSESEHQLQQDRGPEYEELEVSDHAHGFGEEEDARFYEEFTGYDERGTKTQTWKRKRFTLIHLCLTALGCLGVYAAVSVIWSAANHSRSGGRAEGADSMSTAAADDARTETGGNEGGPSGRGGKKLLTYDNFASVNGLVQSRALDWVAHPSDGSVDGLYREATNDMFVIRKIDNGTWEHVLAKRAEVEAAAAGLEMAFTPEWWSVSADWEYMLFNVKMERQWRHSAKGTYVVYNTRERTMIPLGSAGSNAVQRVEWAPTGHRLQFVRDNNIFVTDMMREIQITEDGSDSVSNGVADWVYEEEVLGSSASGLWSPDGEAVAFLRLDDTKVPVFQFQMFHPQNRSALYPENIEVRYPSPGTPNPLVSLFVCRPDFGGASAQNSKASDNPDTRTHPQQISFESPFAPEDTIIVSMAWLTDHSDRLIVHVMNRVQDHLKVYMVSTNPKQLSGRLVRQRNTASAGGDGAWIEIPSPPIYVPPNTVANLTTDGYLEVVENGEYMHLALFSPPEAAQPVRWLTSGNYDVVSNRVALDRKAALVRFLSTQQSSIQPALYQVALNSNSTGAVPHALSPPTLKSASARLNARGARHGSYDASFSAGASFYMLSYKGPRLPWQAVYSSADPGFEFVLNDNANAEHELAAFNLPTTEFFEIANDAGDMMNAMAMYPPDFDRSARKKYGVLFFVYGGPNSQHVSQAFSLDWMGALVSQQDVPGMQWIVVRVDARGTGHKGRRFRSAVNRRLGVIEPADQAAAARHFQTLPYVNPHRIAIWGWSYGGYVTARAVEHHSDVFRVGMAVAPVSDWRFYDSIYTERYMKTPLMNPDGYAASAVSNVSGFAGARFLVQHGTADDNVHMKNTLALTTLLQTNNVPGFEMALYADSDHSIYTYGVRPALYARMVNFLFRSFHELENSEFSYWAHTDPNDDASS